MLNLKELAIKRDNIALKTYNEFKRVGECCATCEFLNTYYEMFDEAPTCNCELETPNFSENKIYEFKCINYRKLLRYRKAIKRINNRNINMKEVIH